MSRRILVACEYSGVVRDAFANRGWDAWSADLLPSESWQRVVFASELTTCDCCGEEAFCPIHKMHFADCLCLEPTQDDVMYREDGGQLLGSKHIQGDVLKILSDGWDAMIAHPPCTHLCVSGAKHFAKKRADGRQQQGIQLFMAFASAPIKRICIENPVGIMSNVWREPDQIIQPYYFGDEAQKTTCLWLKNLPPLQHAAEDDWFAKKTHVGRGAMHKFASGKVMPEWYFQAWKEPDGGGKARSKTFQGIADAMAEQWSAVIK